MWIMTEVFKRGEKLIFITMKSNVTDLLEATSYDQSIYSGILGSYSDCQQGIQFFFCISILIYKAEYIKLIR